MFSGNLLSCGEKVWKAEHVAHVLVGFAYGLCTNVYMGVTRFTGVTRVMCPRVV